jgi:hypothetical protein
MTQNRKPLARAAAGSGRSRDDSSLITLSDGRLRKVEASAGRVADNERAGGRPGGERPAGLTGDGGHTIMHTGTLRGFRPRAAISRVGDYADGVRYNTGYRLWRLRQLLAGREIPAGKRTADAPQPGGFWVLQLPLTRAPKSLTVRHEEIGTIVRVVTGAYVETFVQPARPPLTAAEAERRAAWLAEHPPLGWPVPGLRLQWPLRRVPAGMRLFGELEGSLLDTAIRAGVAQGLRDGLGERAAEMVAGQ